MNNEKITQLLTAVRQRGQAPVGPHLSDADFIAFVEDKMSSAQEDRLDAHLATCPACTAELDAYFEAPEVLPQLAWEQHRPAFVQRLRARLQEEGILPRPAVAADKREPVDLRTWGLANKWPVDQPKPAAWHPTAAAPRGIVEVPLHQEVDSALETIPAWFLQEKPAAWFPTAAAPRGIVEVPLHQEVGSALGRIPVWLPQKNQNTVLLVTQKPVVSLDGRLRMRIRVQESDFSPGERFELILVVVPDGEVVGSPVTCDPSKEPEPLLAFDLQPEQQSAWQDIQLWGWKDLPLRVVLRSLGVPDKEPNRTEAATRDNKTGPHDIGTQTALQARVSAYVGG